MGQFSLEPHGLPMCMASPQCGPKERIACRCLFDHLGTVAKDDAAATSHLLALTESRGVVDEANDELANRSSALIAAAGQVDTAVRRLRTFIREHKILDARRAEAALARRHDGDGAFSRSRRLLPHPWLAHAIILVAAVFDTMFFGALFRYLVNADTETTAGKIEAGLAYMPGLGLAAILLVTGLQLAETLERWKARRSAGPDGVNVPRPEWILPLGLLVVVMVTVGAAAWARSEFVAANAVNTAAASGRLGLVEQVSGVVPVWVVILLLLMLSTAAVVAEVTAHNSFADSLHEVKAGSAATRERYDNLCSEIEAALVALDQRSAELRAAISRVISKIEDLWAAVAWHHDNNRRMSRNEADDHPVSDGPFADLVWHTPKPPPAFGPVLSAAHTVRSWPAEPKRAAYGELTAEADAQWTQIVEPDSMEGLR